MNLRSPYARRPGERAADHVHRLLVDPAYAYAGDREFARFVPEGPAFIAACRANRDLIALVGNAVVAKARVTARMIGWDGDLADLLEAALVALELEACAEERCTHTACAQQRRAPELRRAA